MEMIYILYQHVDHNLQKQKMENNASNAKFFLRRQQTDVKTQLQDMNTKWSGQAKTTFSSLVIIIMWIDCCRDVVNCIPL